MSEVASANDGVADDVTPPSDSTDGAPLRISLGAPSVWSRSVGAPGIAASSDDATVVGAEAALAEVKEPAAGAIRSLPALRTEATGEPRTRVTLSVPRSRAAGASADAVSSIGSARSDAGLVATGNVEVEEITALPGRIPVWPLDALSDGASGKSDWKPWPVACVTAEARVFAKSSRDEVPSAFMLAPLRDRPSAQISAQNLPMLHSAAPGWLLRLSPSASAILQWE
ncbi:hypothetical protein [Inquilinus sp.]|uniref:hypothetical protein n=1 Tax=Inquilinus sp. TaxID=1932117 RepID=UPI003783FE0B